MGSINQAKNEARRFYNNWRKRKTYCPALKSYVRITLRGWRHISGATGDKKRNLHDTYRRLKLLPYAKKIIEESHTVQNITTKNGRKYFVLEAMVDVKENKSSGLRKVRVILIEDSVGNRVFLSVMDKKKNPKKKSKTK